MAGTGVKSSDLAGEPVIYQPRHGSGLFCRPHRSRAAPVAATRDDIARNTVQTPEILFTDLVIPDRYAELCLQKADELEDAHRVDHALLEQPVVVAQREPRPHIQKGLLYITPCAREDGLFIHAIVRLPC